MKRCWGSDLLMVSSAPPRFVMEEMLPTHGSGEADAFLCAVTDVACAPPPQLRVLTLFPAPPALTILSYPKACSGMFHTAPRTHDS